MAYQLGIFAENGPGRIEKITRTLAEADVNIRIASAGEFGVIQLLVDAPRRGYEVLKAADVPVTRNEIVAVSVEDRPGTLHAVTKTLSDHGINIEDAGGFEVLAAPHT